MAYEVAAIYDKPVKQIDLSHNESGEDLKKSFNVKVNTENCSLFLARKALNVTIKESPDFIKNRLSLYSLLFGKEFISPLVNKFI